jgi:peptidoglycan/LPS O-acetylase OafA/YrhL
VAAVGQARSRGVSVTKGKPLSSWRSSGDSAIGQDHHAARRFRQPVLLCQYSPDQPDAGNSMTSLTQTASIREVTVNAMKPHPDTQPSMTLATGLSGRRNAFGFLRFSLASLVLFDHMWLLGGYGEDPTWKWTGGQDSSGGIAVAGFFAISGYLITKSAFRTDVVQFMWHRVLRILPAFWLLILVTAFIVGPALWWHAHGGLGGYFARVPGGPFGYIKADWDLNLTQYGIHDLLTGTPYGQASKSSVFNGSLWTLIYEWRCYLVVAGLTMFGVLKGARPMVAVIAVALWLLTILQSIDPAMPGRIAPWLADTYTVRFTMIFMVGAAFAAYADRVPLNDRFGLLAGVLYLGSIVTGGYLVIGYPAMAYLLLWVASRLRGPLARIGAVNDYSYGVYIYGFLVQQLLAGVGVHTWGHVTYLAISFALTLLCAMASWHLLEKHALRLKHWGPGQGGKAFARGILSLVRRDRAATRAIAPSQPVPDTSE